MMKESGPPRCLEGVVRGDCSCRGDWCECHGLRVRLARPGSPGWPLSLREGDAAIVVLEGCNVEGSAQRGAPGGGGD